MRRGQRPPPLLLLLAAPAAVLLMVWPNAELPALLLGCFGFLMSGRRWGLLLPRWPWLNFLNKLPKSG